MRGRKLYLKLAEASYQNAVGHFNDSKALRKRGSRGHACALAILSIEEAAKAYLYKLAGEGIYRIVTKKPNGISTYSEKQLFDHRFKHQVFARLLLEGISYLPIQRVLSKTRKRSFSRTQVQLLMSDLLREQALQQLKLRAGGRAGNTLKQVFDLLEGLDGRKNAGLYVGHRGGHLVVPNDLSRKTLYDVIELTAESLDAIGAILDTRFPPKVKQHAASAVREIAKAVKESARERPSPPSKEAKGERA